MNRRPNEPHPPCDLLGYVLGALEPTEQQLIERHIANHPELSDRLRQIRSQVSPLSGLDPPGPPPAGLARRTCERIAPLGLVSGKKSQPVDTAMWDRTHRGNRNWFSDQSEPASNRRSWSLSDFITVAVVALVLAAIVVPAINYGRFQSRLLNCQENLRTVGLALLEYARNRGGKHIEIPRQGNLAVAGFYATELCSSGLIDDGGLFLCAGRGDTDRYVPNCTEVMAANSEQLIQLQKQMGGDYAFTLGYFDKQRYAAPLHQARSNYLLLADMPSVDLPGRASRNHDGYGQNCLFDDGHVRFLASPAIAEDSIYENDWAQVAPGTHVNDNVVAPSQTRIFALD